MKKVFMIEVKQPIGTFYIGKMNATDIINISKVSRRIGESGHQRQLKEKRAKEIAQYCHDPDATFPTPIILAINADELTLVDIGIEELICFEYDQNKKIAEILDGQHRIAGIELTEEKDFDLPVVIMLNLKEEQKAYVFSTINGNQAKVDRSLIYDLFELTDARSPYKTCHQIARAMNSDEESPFYRRLKMLEKKSCETETISQSTFVTNLCELISMNSQEDEINLKRGKKLSESIPNKKLVFRKYFIDERDDVILRILNNYFGAAANVFENEWNNPYQYILTKSVGFEGLVSALAVLVPNGEKIGDLSKEHFEKIFRELKVIFENEHLDFSSKTFPSNSQSASQISKYIINANDNIWG